MLEEFVRYYTNLLIIQYYNKPKAKAEIEALVSIIAENNILNLALQEAFDINIAVGNQLDILGRIIGLNRVTPFIIPKVQFGFEGTDTSASFGLAPFADATQNNLTSLELTDGDYRFFLRAKIIKNITSNTILSDDRIGINEALDFLFNGQAIMIDNRDMTQTLQISETVDLSLLRNAIRLQVIPKAAGVGLNIVVVPELYFGFSIDEDAQTFGEGFFSKAIVV